MSMNFKILLNQVKAFVFDIDGVLTDGSLILMPDGEQLRTMNIKDGYALQLAIEKGYKIGIISGGKSEISRLRLNSLGIHDIYLNVQDKIKALNEFSLKYAINFENVLYMGDDMPDYAAMKKIGIPVCPKDAANEIKEISVYISDKNGGKACVRDVIEQALKLHGKWQ